MIKDVEFFIKRIFFSESYLLKKRILRAINKSYEKELKIVERYSDTSKDAIDIGVYRGVYSYKLAQNFKKVHAFEPNPLLYPYLEKNLKKIIKNLKLYNIALSDSNGTGELRLPLRSKSFFKNNIEELYKLGAATMHPNNHIGKYKKVPIKMGKLDDIINDDKIGFIKIDVEGHEKNVLLGGRSIINRDKPVLLIEIEERHTKIPIKETINFIKNLNYNCYYFSENELKDIQSFNQTNFENNFIFLPK